MPSRHVRDRVDEYLAFREALRSTLATGDAKQFKQFLRDAAQDYGDSDLAAMGRWTEEALLPIMHRMIVADAKLTERHAESKKWLRDRQLPMRSAATGYGWGNELKRRYRDAGEHRQTA